MTNAILTVVVIGIVSFLIGYTLLRTRWKKRYYQLELEKEKLEADYMQLGDRLRESNKLNKSLERSLSERERRLLIAERDLQEANEKTKALELERQAVQAQINEFAEVSDERTKLEEKTELLQSELGAVAIEKREIEDRLGITKEQYQALLERTESLSAELNKVNAVSREMQQEVLEVTEEKQILLTKLAEKNAEGGEAKPPKNKTQSHMSVVAKNGAAVSTQELGLTVEDDANAVPRMDEPGDKIDNRPTTRIEMMHVGLLNKLHQMVLRVGEAEFQKKDELTMIHGILPQIENMLNKIGLYQFEQIAKLNNEELNLIEQALNFSAGRIRGESWVDQASVIRQNRAII